jgi:phosphoribosylamine--glycine ligase
MKVLLLDNDAEGMGLDLAMRSHEAGHEVKYALPTTKPYGDGLIEKVDDWEAEMDWAELIVLTGNATYAGKLAEYFGRGYPIFGANAKAAELELDRAKGQEVLAAAGIETIPYQVVESAQEAIDLIVDTGQAYAMKPWGGEADKAMTCVASTPDEAIFTLQKWEADGKFKGHLMMQERVKGVEMGIAGWFGPAGWSQVIEESFEHKKLMNDDYGCNTGEQGTVLRHVTQSKLFDMILAPITDYLHECNYVGCCSVNCMIDKRGTPWPMEWTNRLGWPAACIMQEVVQGDPIQWMYDLLHGEDTLRVSTKVAVGAVLTHGDYPWCHDPAGTWEGFPIYGLTDENYGHVHFQQVKAGSAPKLVDGAIKQAQAIVTAGCYVLVATGSARTVSGAQDACYEVAKALDWPSDVMMRTDIGSRLEKELPLLQKHGFAAGMRF